MVRPERSRYLQSLAEELSAPANRIRNLIGDRHWPTDGAYKEHLLGSVIRRHCPDGLTVARGFVVSDLDQTVVSREQDLLLVDTTREAPLFYEAGVIVSFPRNVVGAISVKSSPNKGEVEDVVSTLNSLRTAAAHPNLEPSHIWCGAYVFSAPKTSARMYKYIADGIRSAPITSPAALSGNSASRPRLRRGWSRPDLDVKCCHQWQLPDRDPRLLLRWLINRVLSWATSRSHFLAQRPFTERLQ